MCADNEGMTAGERFSVVVVNYNGAGVLLEAVRSAVAEGVLAESVVVVDNGSADGSLAEVEAGAPGVRVLRNGCNAGFARAVNRGLREIGRATEFVLLLNNDARLEFGALAALAEAFDERPKLAIAGGQLRYPGGRLQSAFAPLPTLTEELIPMNFLKWARPARYVRTSASGETREVESVFGACLAVRVAALESFGLMDEEFFFYFEEVEWCRRAGLAGWTLAHVPGARVEHALGLTANRFRGEARIELQRSKLQYFRKCGSRGAYLLLSGFLVFRTLVNAVFGSLAVILTLGLQGKVRRNTAAYWRMSAWHAAGRPEGWGLPGKCRGSTFGT